MKEHEEEMTLGSITGFVFTLLAMGFVFTIGTWAAASILPHQDKGCFHITDMGRDIVASELVACDSD